MDNNQPFSISKPLGFYTSYTPGDGSCFEKLEEMFGCNLSRLTRREKLFLSGVLSLHLSGMSEGSVRNNVYACSADIPQSLNESDIEGLIEFLVNSVRF